MIGLGGIPNKTQVGNMGIDGHIVHRLTVRENLDEQIVHKLAEGPTGVAF